MKSFWKYGLSMAASAACVAMPGAAVAALKGPIPSQLYNKTVMVTWSEGRDMKTTDGHPFHRNVNSEYAIYISSAGRLFSRQARTINNRRNGRVMNASASSSSPEGRIATANVRYTRDLHFEGNALHAETQFESGARRITISFDGGFGSCTVKVIYGKEEGAPGIVSHGMNQRLHMLTDVSIAGESCSIREGNAVADTD